MRSARLTPAAATSTRTSPGPGRGSATSVHWRTSGSPGSLMTTACIAASLAGISLTRVFQPIGSGEPRSELKDAANSMARAGRWLLGAAMMADEHDNTTASGAREATEIYPFASGTPQQSGTAGGPLPDWQAAGRPLPDLPVMEQLPDPDALPDPGYPAMPATPPPVASQPPPARPPSPSALPSPSSTPRPEPPSTPLPEPQSPEPRASEYRAPVLPSAAA